MFIESFESRTLMSVTPISTQVAADRLQVRADLLLFRSDAVTGTAHILADVASLKADGLRKDPTMLPLFKQLNTDLQHMRTQLRIDRLTEAGNVLKDQSVIVMELRKILLDHGDQTKVAADRTQLLSDRIQLQNDEIAGLTARLTTRQNAYTTIFNDLDAITSGLADDTTGSAKLGADVEKFTINRTTILNAMSTDLQKLIGDRTQLVNDLTAMQNS